MGQVTIIGLLDQQHHRSSSITVIIITRSWFLGARWLWAGQTHYVNEINEPINGNTSSLHKIGNAMKLPDSNTMHQWPQGQYDLKRSTINQHQCINRWCSADTKQFICLGFVKKLINNPFHHTNISNYEGEKGTKGWRRYREKGCCFKSFKGFRWL